MPMLKWIGKAAVSNHHRRVTRLGQMHLHCRHVSRLLVVSHIFPRGESTEHRDDPRNGICLNALFDRAYDRGLIAIDERLRVVVAAELQRAADTAELHCSLVEAHGRPLLAAPPGHAAANPRARRAYD